MDIFDPDKFVIYGTDPKLLKDSIKNHIAQIGQKCCAFISIYCRFFFLFFLPVTVKAKKKKKDPCSRSEIISWRLEQ